MLTKGRRNCENTIQCVFWEVYKGLQNGKNSFLKIILRANSTLEAYKDKILCYVINYIPEFENYNFWRQDDLGFITLLSKCIYAKAFLT